MYRETFFSYIETALGVFRLDFACVNRCLCVPHVLTYLQHPNLRIHRLRLLEVGHAGLGATPEDLIGSTRA
eukprot:1140998-Amorphochlora_amoeboformis.AAC.1